MSRWLVITLAGVFITAAITIGVLIFLMKKMEKEEDEADRLYLQQKADLLKNAVAANLKDSSGLGQKFANQTLKSVNDTKDTVLSSTSKLNDIVLKQKSYLQDLKNRYSQETKKIFA